MKSTHLAVSAMLLSLSVASAQAADTDTTKNNQAATTSTNQAVTSSAANASSGQSDQMQSGSVNIRQQIHNTLSKDGYTDIQVMPSSFTVRAKDQKGRAVAMVVGPDSVTSVTELNANGQPKTDKDGSNQAKSDTNQNKSTQ